MITLLEREIGNAEVVRTEIVSGPRGGKAWKIMHLSDRRIALVGPYSFNCPLWIEKKTGKKFKHAGGTTYNWSGYISVEKGEAKK